MNRTKSILLAGVALALFAAPQVARAQSAVVFLPEASSGTVDCPLVAVAGSSSASISGDGRFVVGAANSPCLVAWRDGVPQVLDDTSPLARNGGGIEYATGMSADGSVIVGSRNISSNLQFRAPTVIWTATTGSYLPPEPIVGNRRAVGGGYVNSDGTIFALNTLDYAFSSSFGQNINSGLGYVYRWSAAGGFQEIGRVDASFSMFARGIDGSGSAIVGVAENPSTFNDPFGAETRAFLWRSGSGLTTLPDLSSAPPVGTNRYSEANGISRDGTTIIGQSRVADGRVQAVYWRGGAITGLGWLPGASPADSNPFATNVTQALAANASGDIIVGKAIGSTTDLAWRWTATSGMQDLNLFATNAGINLGGFVLTDAVGLSDSGQYITGNSFNAAQDQSRGYVLSISAAPPPTDAGLVFLPEVSLAGAPQQCGTAGINLPNTSIIGISADGTVAGGESTYSNCVVLWRNGVPELQPGGFVGLPNYGNIPGQLSAFSGNGRVLVGFSASQPVDGSLLSYSNGLVAYWQAGQDTRYLPDIETLTAAQFNGSLATRLPFRAGSAFQADSDVRRLAFGPAFVNNDGSYFAVNSAYSANFSENGEYRRAQFDGRVFRWSPVTGYLELPNFGSATAMAASGIDGSGNRIVGLAVTGPATALFEQETFAFVWDATGGLARLPDLAASLTDPARLRITLATGISRDGTTIIGTSRAADGIFHPVLWRGNAIIDLGFLAGRTPTTVERFNDNSHVPLAASAGGNVIVGTAGNDFPQAGLVSTTRAWRWSATTGMQDLNQLATNAGFNLNGFELYEANGVSDNGVVISGNSFSAAQNLYRGYVLSITAAPPSPTTLTTSARLIVSLTLPGVTQTSIVNQTFSTQVDAVLNGSNVFTRTVGDQVTGSLGVTALADARTALQASSGLRRVVIGAPVLVSNVTTVLSSSNSTVNVASGTQVTTAAVVTNGPATIATGDLGTCATAATDGINPTGCSLPGTAVAVNANVINTNTFTNTINSVTPTTTTTVNQLISAKWQVSATAGNQFGTVHALVGPATFDRGDRLIGQLLGMGGSSAQGENANRLSRTAMPVRDASGFGGDDGGLTMFGGYFGNWQHTDADPSVPVADVKGSTNGFVLGLEKGFGAARVGVAVDHGTSNYTVRDATYPETLGFKHTQVALFAGWQSGGFSLDGAAAFGFGTARTSLVTPTTPATASRDVKGWSLGAQAGYAVPLGRNASVELVGGVRHVSANLKAFTESGGPSPLQGRDQTVHRTRAYGGIEAQAGIALGSVTLTPRLHARYAHDNGDASGTADLVFASAPNGPVMQALGPGVGRDVAELGGSIDAAVGGSVHLWAGYDGTFRKGAQTHAAKAGVTLVW